MMKKSIILVAICLGIASSVLCQDQQTWTLENCLSYAMENNISLKRQELSTAISQKDYAQSKLNVLPDLNGQVQHEIGSGRVLDRGTYEWLNTDVNQGDLGLVSNFTLFRGLQGYNSIKMAEANYNVSCSTLELYKNNLLLQVMTGYLELLRNMDLYEIAQEKVRVTDMQVERMERLAEVGNASAGEVLEVKSQASAERYNMTLAKNNLELARLSLIHLMNLPEDPSFTIEKPEIEDPSMLQMPEMIDVYAKAVEILPQIKSAEHSIKYQEKNLAVTRAALSPELFLRALYYSNYSDKLINPREVDPFNPVLDYTIPQQVTDNQYRQVSVGLNIPIFNKWQGRTNISKAKIGLEDAHYQLENERQQLFKDIQQYHTDALAALDNYEAAKEANANAEEAYRYSEEKFKVGMATALELEEARNRLFQSRSEMVSAKYVFVFYSRILDFYQGEELSL